MAFRNAVAYDEVSMKSNDMCHRLATHRFGMPSASTPFEPAQVASTTSCAKYDIRIALDLFKRYRLVRHNGIVFCVQTESWDSYRHHRISRTSISIVCSFGWVTPRRTLHLPVKFVEVLDFSDILCLESSVDADLILVCFEELEHVRAHELAVEVQPEPCALKGEGGDFELPRVGHDDCGREEAILAFFS